jgi:hypothetical protein
MRGGGAGGLGGGGGRRRKITAIGKPRIKRNGKRKTCPLESA